MKVQTSRDGKDWRDLYVVGGPVTFKSKKAAREWFDQLESANSLDWKVGFLHCYRDGTQYRLVDRKHQPVRYA
jgi:hypothetical protein